MHITPFAAALASSALLFAGLVGADVQYNATTYVGCYSTGGAMSKSDSFTYQSFGHCQGQCIPKSGENPQPVMGLNKGSDCWCGSALPPESDKVDDKQCDKGCTGFGTDMCGGASTFSVYLTGYDNSVGTAAGSGSGSSSSSVTSAPAASSAPGSTTVSQAPSVITKAGETIVITASGQAEATNQPSGGGGSGGGSKVGIAVGIVVGVVVLFALIGGGIFFIRHRKRKAVEEEYRRNQAINSFVTSDKPASKGGSISDQRLDPSILHHRRQSDGSIADEMDFSRRILQVCQQMQQPVRKMLILLQVRNPDSV
jgi:cell wall integrity and stress response component